MRPVEYSVEQLCGCFENSLIVSFKELRRALDWPGRATLFRMLDKIDAISSYSHRGKYHTLRRIAHFNARGLWNYQQVRFSRFGNLLETLQRLVERSEQGYSAKELEKVVEVKTKHALVELVRREQLARQFWDGIYIYFSIQNTGAREQQKARRQRVADLPTALLGSNSRLALAEAKAALLLFWTTLDERQRRLYAGLESAKLGHGGDVHIAGIFGIDRQTVARGREELLDGIDPAAPVRQAGGGRALQEKKRPKS